MNLGARERDLGEKIKVKFKINLFGELNGSYAKESGLIPTRCINFFNVFFFLFKKKNNLSKFVTLGPIWRVLDT